MMDSLTISLHFPTGRYAAASWDDAERTEWPPHPARLCLGLLDALHRSGNGTQQRESLLWLCALPTPDLVIPDGSRVDLQNQTGFFVPQNPAAAGSISHTRKARAFPAAFLDADQPTVFFHWPQLELSAEHLQGLTELLRSLPRFGHSSSLVIAEVSTTPPPTGAEWQLLRPLGDDNPGSPEHRLRVPWDGLIASAENAYNADGRSKEMSALIDKNVRLAKPDKSLKPKASPRGRHDPRHLWQGYAEPQADQIANGPWDSRVLLLSCTGGNQLDLPATWQLTEVLHKTLLDRWDRQENAEPIPAWISGHLPRPGSGNDETPNHGAPSDSNHLAFFPLPFVGHRHASGAIKGIGLALPDAVKLGIDATTFRLQWRKAMAALLDENGELWLSPTDRSWTMTLSPESSPQPIQALRPRHWTGPACRWHSVTPIILDRHPKPHFKKDPQGWAESCRNILRRACRNLQLPDPIEIEPSLASEITAVPPGRAFPAPAARRGRPPRFHVHARITFAEPVQGPLLLGAGRYRGYGLCLPQKTADRQPAS